MIDDKTDEVAFLVMGKVQTHMDTCIILNGTPAGSMHPLGPIVQYIAEHYINYVSGQYYDKVQSIYSVLY